MRDVKLGFRTYFKSFSFIVQNRMIHYYVYPIIIIVLLALGATAGIRSLVDSIEMWVMAFFPQEATMADGWWDQMKLWFSDISKYVISAFLWVAFYFIYYKLSKYIVLILMSPVMALVSEKTESVLTGREYPFQMSQFIKDVWRGVLIAIRNMIMELGMILGIWVVSFGLTFLFPPIALIVTPVSAVLSFVIGAYYYGFATMDYTNERRKMNVRESVTFIRKYRGLAIANGSIFTLWIMIPILGTYIGTVFAPITCTVGATLAIHEAVDLKGDSILEKKSGT